MALGREILYGGEQCLHLDPEGLSEALADICGRQPVSAFDAADIALPKTSLFAKFFLAQSYTLPRHE